VLLQTGIQFADSYGPDDPTAAMSPAPVNFKTVIQNVHQLLDVIDREVTETIDSRDPNAVSASLAPRASIGLLGAYAAFTKYSDKLASFAAGTSHFDVTLIGGFHKTTTIQVASELGVAGDHKRNFLYLRSRIELAPTSTACVRMPILSWII